MINTKERIIFHTHTGGKVSTVYVSGRPTNLRNLTGHISGYNFLANDYHRIAFIVDPNNIDDAFEETDICLFSIIDDEINNVNIMGWQYIDEIKTLCEIQNNGSYLVKVSDLENPEVITRSLDEAGFRTIN